MKRVTGIGGIFFKAKDPEGVKQWYATHLGLDTTPWGCSFHWKDAETGAPGRTEWSAMKAETKYFAPSESSFMINYRVENLEALVEALKAEGVTVVGDPETSEYGKFAWILDPEGNKVELWEPPVE